MLTKELSRIGRHKSIRKRIQGTSERPRLNVHRSSKHLYVQVIDDMKAHTLFSFSTKDKELDSGSKKMTKVAKSEKLGEIYGPKLKEKGIKKIAFDRSGYKYHGRVKALAEALRKAGIEF